MWYGPAARFVRTTDVWKMTIGKKKNERNYLTKRPHNDDDDARRVFGHVTAVSDDDDDHNNNSNVLLYTTILERAGTLIGLGNKDFSDSFRPDNSDGRYCNRCCYRRRRRRTVVRARGCAYKTDNRQCPDRRANDNNDDDDCR